MTAELRELVAETADLTGAEGPAVWGEGAPVLDTEAAAQADGAGVYFVGLIGGKDVGKSALVNALVGQPVTEPIGWGEGTQGVIAYAHTGQAAAVRAVLEREVPGRYRVVTHEVTDLRRQVLLDLPDIDSHWSDHVAVTRKMLRHMLYPIWVQSVEKYADRQVQDLLRQVSAGNDPANFVFVLNKVDQLGGSGGAPSPEPVNELRDDFARRIANVLRRDELPRVYAVAATRPDAFELPELRRLLSRERSTAAVRTSLEQASRRQAVSVLDWVRGQQLPAQLERLRRLEEQAEELIQARVTPLVLEQTGRAVGANEDDVAGRLELIDASLGRRVRRWPLVNVLQALLWPVLAMIRANVARGVVTARGRESLHERLAAAVQAVFAQLYQSQPAIAALYAHRKLWEGMIAEHAAARLGDAVGQTHGTTRSAVVEAAGRGHAILAPVRWALTIGALLWFPLVQPLAAELLTMGQAWAGWTDVWLLAKHLGLLLVRAMSVTYLLENAVFLLLWYFVLWLLLRWHTQRRVDRVLAGRERDGDTDAAGAAAREWVDDLLSPIRRRVERVGKVVQVVERMERGVE